MPCTIRLVQRLDRLGLWLGGWRSRPAGLHQLDHAERFQPFNHTRYGRQATGVLGTHMQPIGRDLNLEPPTRDMLAAAAAAGFYRSPGWQRDYPRLQVLTIEDLLRGAAQVKMPPAYAPYKQAERVGAPAEQGQFG